MTLTSASESPNTARSARPSAMSPLGVPVACALTSVTSPGCTPAERKALRMASAAQTPFGSGATRWAASHVAPAPSRLAQTRAPRAAACWRRSAIRTAAPSPTTKPFRSRSKGREAALGSPFLVDSARRDAKAASVSGCSTASVPPMMAASISSSRNRRSAYARASALDAHALASDNADPRAPNSAAMAAELALDISAGTT